MSSGSFSQNSRKRNLTYFDFIWGKKNPEKYRAMIFIHLQVTSVCLWTKFRDITVKAFWRKENGQNFLKNQCLPIFKK